MRLRDSKYKNQNENQIQKYLNIQKKLNNKQRKSLNIQIN